MKTPMIAIVATVLLVLGGTAISAQQDKYTLKTPSGVAFSDFKQGW